MKFAIASAGRCRIAGTAVFGLALTLSGSPVAAAGDHDDPPPPPADVGAATAPSPPTFLRGQRRHELALGPVAPAKCSTGPQVEVTQIKSLLEKRARLKN